MPQSNFAVDCVPVLVNEKARTAVHAIDGEGCGEFVHIGVRRRPHAPTL